MEAREGFGSLGGGITIVCGMVARYVGPGPHDYVASAPNS